VEIDLPFSEFNRLFDYSPQYKPYGFFGVAESKLKDFYMKYDDLYSILLPHQVWHGC